MLSPQCGLKLTAKEGLTERKNYRSREPKGKKVRAQKTSDCWVDHAFESGDVTDERRCRYNGARGHSKKPSSVPIRNIIQYIYIYMNSC